MIQATGNDLVVIASNAAEMAESQAALVAEFRRKEAAIELEIGETSLAIDEALKAGINPNALNKVLRRQESRKTYLGKIAAALEAGYVIVPNFDAKVIAIRVKDNRQPRGKAIMAHHKNFANVNAESGDILPVGEGKYVDPLPLQTQEHVPAADPAKSGTWLATPAELRDEFDLPVEFMKPTIIQRTGICAARKIFDEIAVTPSFRRPGEDPMVLGRVRDKATGKMVTFLVAWFMDTAAV
jgi:flagellar basal body rod protein FlgC